MPGRKKRKASSSGTPPSKKTRKSKTEPKTERKNAADAEDMEITSQYTPVPQTPPPIKFGKDGIARLKTFECELVVGSDVLCTLPGVLKEKVKASKYVVVTDENVHRLVYPRLAEAFRLAGMGDPPVKILPPGEATKSRQSKKDIEDWLFSLGCDRKACLIALGGGVVGDLVGFVAATYMRGIKVVQVPTSLLAMVDASVGAKTAVDVPQGKNLVGAFHMPTFVFIDIDLLDTLPLRHWRNGMAEIIKMGAILDAQLFSALEGGVERESKHAVSEIVLRSVQLKAFVVEQDMKEGGLRAILNYGHSIGHAVEALMDWSLLHGECVAIGLVKEGLVARRMGISPAVVVSRLLRCLKLYSLPVEMPPDLPLEKVFEKMNLDKKNSGGKKRMVAILEIGKAINRAIDVDEKDLSFILSECVKVVPQNTPLSGEVRVPGSKSISNRVLLMAVLGKGPCRIHNLLHSDDTQVMLDALQALGAPPYRWENNGKTLVVEGAQGNLHAATSPVFLGNAGTASRFLTTVCTLVSEGTTHLTGVKRMKERPIKDLVNALRSIGCSIEYCESEGCLPLDIDGSGLPGGTIELAASVSSQFVSSILLSGPYATAPVTLKLVGEVVSQPYIDMTVSLMRQFGVNVEAPEKNTYVIGTGAYINPSSIYIESDASSASYPLCLAAATGGTVTALGIGSESLQGDAGFCRILEQFGCTLEQTADATKVTGPKDGLKAVDVDMETTTDAFMGAAVLGALATGVTSITGIANQRVKECNRIAVMVSELGKCGVTARELPDGIQIDGVGGKVNALRPATIDCFHDHRIAMSFAVLGAVVPDITITQKECVGKTYSEFWEEMRNTLGMVSVAATVGPTAPIDPDTSVVLVGMRGAGKTSLGKAGAQALGWTFVDMDDTLAEHVGMSVTAYIEASGWETFRKTEADLLASTLSTCGTRTIIGCGGGVVETPSARELLAGHSRVIHIARNVDDILAYLAADASRPGFADPNREVWERRAPLYATVSSHEFVVRRGDTDWSAVNGDFASFLARLRTPPKPVHTDSFFLSLTFGDLTKHVGLLKTIQEGCHALELRVDLLDDHSVRGVGEQVGILRRHSTLPIIFTVRTLGQGGKFPEDEQRVFELLRASVKWGCEYIDVEACWSEKARVDLWNGRQSSRILASFHEWDAVNITAEILAGWAANCYLGGKAHVVKIVFAGKSVADCTLCHSFVSSRAVPVPVICICTGELGQLSRVLNRFMTPVTHGALPSKAAPGQLSVAEIKSMRQLVGINKRETLSYYLFGSPVSKSISPAMHNAGFKAEGLPHSYKLYETSDPQVVKEVCWSDDFGGANVTIPLKQDILDLIHDMSPAARDIGAVNTIERRGSSLYGDNTDWVGISRAVEQRMPADFSGVALVLGAGGTARAAVYAMSQLGFDVRICNRTVEKAEELACAFDAKVVTNLSQFSEELKSSGALLRVIISTLPLAASAVDVVPSGLFASHPVVLDAVYRPRVTPLLEEASKAGCAVIEGVEMLIGQGCRSFELWTGAPAPVDAMTEAALQQFDGQT